ncbi:MAG: ribonuclease HIII [Kiritimatiellae bacterium]|nr:ribonuclease HIII [Kiritimatiellia bacterium]
MEQTTFTYELDEAQQNLLLAMLSAGNYRPRSVPYSLASVEGEGFNCTLYQKEKHGRRKCCIQGGKARDFVEFFLEPNVLGAATLGYEDVLDPERNKPHGGSDESGKGDYFGPLVAACCYVDESLAGQMREMGVKDCKQMSDRQILAVGSQVRALLGPSRFACVKIGPAAYNRLYAKIKNVNRLLAWAHGTCIEELLEKQPACPRVVVDQFAPTETVVRRALKERGRKIVVDQHHKAESDVAVAAASVVAREVFLRDLVALFAAAGRKGADAKAGAEATTIADVLKGSSDPRVRQFAEEMVKRHGPTWLMNNCKAHFQTTDKVLSACGFSRADLPPEGRIASAAAAKAAAEA